MKKMNLEESLIEDLVPLVEDSADLKAEEIIRHMFKLDSLMENFRDELPSQFIHYLQQRSYGKALNSIRTGEVNLKMGVS